MQFEYNIYGMPDDGFGMMFAGIWIFGLVFGIAANIAVYVMRSIGVSAIAKRRGLNQPWLAWLPVGYEWIVGSVSDQYQYLVKGQVRNKRKLLLGLSIANTVIRAIAFVLALVMMSRLIIAGDGVSDSHMASIMMKPMISVMSLSGILSVVSIVLLIIKSICMYDLYRSCDPHNAVAYLVLGILFNILEPIFLLIVRKKDGGMPPRRDVPPVLEEPWE